MPAIALPIYVPVVKIGIKTDDDNPAWFSLVTTRGVKISTQYTKDSHITCGLRAQVLNALPKLPFEVGQKLDLIIIHYAISAKEQTLIYAVSQAECKSAHLKFVQNDIGLVVKAPVGVIRFKWFQTFEKQFAHVEGDTDWTQVMARAQDWLKEQK